MQAITTVGDSTKARRAGFYSALILIPYGILAALIGVCAAALFPGIKRIQAMPALIVELDPLPIVLALYASDVLAVTFLAKALRSTRGAGAADVLRSASVRGAADADPSGGYGGRLRLLAEADRANSPPIISREAPRHTAGADALAVGLHRGRGTVDPVVSAWYPPHLSSDRPTSPRGARCSLARCRVVAGTVDLRAQLHQVHVTSRSRTSRRRSPATWRPIGVTASPSARESSTMASTGSPPG